MKNFFIIRLQIYLHDLEFFIYFTFFRFSEKNNMKRHSLKYPCNEHIKVQSEFHSALIKKVLQANPSAQKRLLKKATPCFFKYVSRCADGILKGNVKLTKKRLKTLSPEKQLLLKLVSTSPWQKKRDYFIREQKGGFLSILAGIASAALSSIIGKKLASLL